MLSNSGFNWKEVKIEDSFINTINSKVNTDLQILIKPTLIVKVYYLKDHKKLPRIVIHIQKSLFTKPKSSKVSHNMGRPGTHTII